ncbi:MAG TPA: hypothetical protein VLT83_11590 [Opitutaceae bacterium]|nr:hypothetical protein [Opitutaceae bacterium]
MNWSDLQSVWSGQNLAAGADFDPAALQRDFEAKRRRLARGLFWRDTREAAAGMFVAGVFAYCGWQMGRAGWPLSAAVALMLGLTGFFVRERVRAHRRRVGADAPLLAKLDAEIAELHRQHRLLLTVGTWYLAPCNTAAAIFAITMEVNAPIPLAAKLAAGGIMLGVLATVSWAVWALNRRAARRLIEPRLNELETSRRAFLSFP